MGWAVLVALHCAGAAQRAGVFRAQVNADLKVRREMLAHEVTDTQSAQNQLDAAARLPALVPQCDPALIALSDARWSGLISASARWAMRHGGTQANDFRELAAKRSMLIDQYDAACEAMARRDAAIAAAAERFAEQRTELRQRQAALDRRAADLSRAVAASRCALIPLIHAGSPTHFAGSGRRCS